MHILAEHDGRVLFESVELYQDGDRPRVLVAGGTLRLLAGDDDAAPLQRVALQPYDAPLVRAGERVRVGAPLVERDPFCDRVLAELPAGERGALRYGEDLRWEERLDHGTGLTLRVVLPSPAVLLLQRAGESQRVYAQAGDLLPVMSGASVARGDVLLVRPRLSRRSGEEIGGGQRRLAALLEPRRPCQPALLAPLDGVVDLRFERGGARLQVRGPAGVQELRLGWQHEATVSSGDQVVAGAALTQGERDHRELLRVLGPARYGDHVARELELVFAAVGCPLDTRDIDLLVRAQVAALG